MGSLLRNVTAGHLGKYVIPTTEILTEAMTNSKPISVGVKSLVLKNNPFNKTAIKEWQKLGDGSEKQQTDALNIPLQTTDTKTPIILIGSLGKPKTVNVNKGNVAEGLIAVAVAARFLNKNDAITSDDVFGLIHKLAKSNKVKNYSGKTGKYIEVEYPSPNKNPKINDIVKIYISLAEVNMTALLNPKNKGILEDYVISAVQYANYKNVRKWAITLYENNRFDTIEVISDGLGGETTTKVDFRVKVTNDKGKLVPVNIDLSLKAGDVKQFGQVGGSEFEKQVQLWDTLFGYGTKINTLEETYDNLMFRKKKPAEALTLVYEKIKQLLDEDLNGNNRNKTLKKMADGLDFYLTRGEKSVSLLQLGKPKGSATLYEFKDTNKKIGGLRNLSTEITFSGEDKLPILMISSDNNDLFRIRAKKENKPAGPYIRNYLEKESLMSDLFATIL